MVLSVDPSQKMLMKCEVPYRTELCGEKRAKTSTYRNSAPHLSACRPRDSYDTVNSRIRSRNDGDA